MALDANQVGKCGQTQRTPVIFVGDDEDRSKDAISSIVIAHVETVAEDVAEMEETFSSSPFVEPKPPDSAKRKRISFNCDTCKFSTTTRFSLARHLECHKQSASMSTPINANEEPADQEPAGPSGNVTEPQQKAQGANSQPAKQIKTKIFKCSHCSFSSKFRFIMKKHLLTHIKQPINHKCRYCPFEANSIKALLPHLVNKHRNYNETCPRCQKLVSLQLKSEHLQVCKVRNPTIQCPHCPYKTFNRKQYARHSRNCGNPTTIRKMYSCKFCSFTTTCPRSVRDHTLLHTKLNRPIYQCTYCDYKSTKKNYENHVKSEHQDEPETHESVKMFKCNQCPFTARTQFNFNKHMLTHRKVFSEFQCTLCKFNGINKKSLQTHLGVAHKKLSQKCSRCHCQVPAQMKEKHSLKCRGMATRNTENSEQKEEKLEQDCQSISKELKQETSSKATRLNCDFCTCSFQQLDALSLHLESHGEQLYKCPICEHQATRVSLTRHFEDAHLGQLSSAHPKNSLKEETPESKGSSKKKAKANWTCDFCSFTSAYSFTMKQHCLHHTVQNKPIFRCNHCDYKSIKKIVEKHSMVVHQIPYNYPQSSPGMAIKKDPEGGTSEAKHILFVCEICDYSTYSKEILFQHKTSHTNNENETMKKPTTVKDEETCTKCQRSFSTNHSHKCRVGTSRYRIEYEGSSRMFYCNSCEFKSQGRRSMNRHWTKAHQSHLSMDYEENDHFLLGQNATFKCETCDFQTNLEDSLQNHQVLHININKVKVYKNDTYNVEVANRRVVKSEEESD